MSLGWTWWNRRVVDYFEDGRFYRLSLMRGSGECRDKLGMIWKTVYFDFC